MRGPERSHSHRPRKQNGGCQELGEEGKEELLLPGIEFRFCERREPGDGGDGRTTLWMHFNVTELYTEHG